MTGGRPGSEGTRLVGPALVGAGGLTLFIASEFLGVPPDQIGVATATGLGFTKWLSSTLASHFANLIKRPSSAPVSESEDLLANADWMKLSALAAKTLVLEYADTPGIGLHQKEQVQELAEKLEHEWQALAATRNFREELAKLGRHKAVKYFSKAALTDPTKRQALTISVWESLLRPVGRQHDCLPNGKNLKGVARLLRDKHPEAIYRLLKNKEHGYRPLVGLILKMVGESHDVLINDLPQHFANIQAEFAKTHKASARTEQSLAELKSTAGNIEQQVLRIGENIHDWLRALEAEREERTDRGERQSQFELQRDQWNNVSQNLVQMFLRQETILANQDTMLASDERVEAKVDKVIGLAEQIEKNTNKSGDGSTATTPAPISNFSQHVTERRLFVGREDLLKQLRTSLQGRESFSDHNASDTQAGPTEKDSRPNSVRHAGCVNLIAASTDC